jgi:hypothetical protein
VRERPTESAVALLPCRWSNVRIADDSGTIADCTANCGKLLCKFGPEVANGTKQTYSTVDATSQRE